MQEHALREQRRELDKAQSRYAELDILFQKLFESHATGRISDERFDQLSAGYEEEQRNLKQKLELLSKEVQTADEQSGNMKRFLSVAEKYADLKELTPSILRELISKIVILEPIKLDGKKRIQRIQVHYNFIGAIDAPSGKEAMESA